jgi:GT2 family glycosyltransferase
VGNATRAAAEQIAVSVVTVNWNVRDLLLDSIASVFASAGDLQLEMIVVDNGSTDGSAEAVEARFRRAIVIRNQGNPGFACANNQGARIARGRYVLFLNPDTRVLGDAIPAMVRTMEAHPSIGALGAKLLRSDLRWSRDNGFRFPSIRTVFNEYLQLSRLVPVPWLFPGILRSRDFTGLDECDWVSGAAIMMRRELALAQPWNEEIFFFAEDVEICDRIRRGGLRVAALADARIVHYSGQSMIQQDETFLVDRVSATRRLLGARAHPALVWLAVHIMQGSLLLRSHAHRLKYCFSGDSLSLEKSRRLKQYLGLN